MRDSCHAITRQLSRNHATVVAQSCDSCRAIMRQLSRNHKKRGKAWYITKDILKKGTASSRTS